MELSAAGKLQPFKVGGFIQGSYYTTSRRTCINIGYILEDLTVDVDMNLRLAQCYKDIIECYYNYENWTGPNAKWLEECTLSAPTQTNLWHWDYIKDAATSTYIKEIGDGTDTPKGCWPGIFWTTGTNPLLSELHHNTMMYIMDAMDSLYESFG
jgi:hypothetical protein